MLANTQTKKTKSVVQSTTPAVHVTSLDDLPIFLTPDEASALLRTSRKAIYSLIERGQLPGVRRMRKRILISRDDLLDFLDHNQHAVASGVQR